MSGWVAAALLALAVYAANTEDQSIDQTSGSPVVSLTAVSTE